ncbi:MAG: hypothetical protein PHE09_08830 [Oscillospiraceae bacterium]|nr:hypothetical protein [Oscillospiraceae bacterium]
MDATYNRTIHILIKAVRFLLALPIMAACYLTGWALMLLYSMGGAILSMGAMVTALGCVFCLWQHDYREAVLAAVATGLLCPYGLPMVAMAAGSAALGAAGFLYVWTTK